MNAGLKRFILALYSMILTIVVLIVTFASFSPVAFENVNNYISSDVLGNLGLKLFLILLEVIFLVLSITYLLAGVSDDGEKKSISKFTEIGEIKISLNSIESIALASSKRLNGIKESKAYVYKGADGLIIVIRAIVLSDINIPVLSEDIQVKVKKTVEETSGIKVSEVKVVVDNIFAGYNKSRVE